MAKYIPLFLTAVVALFTSTIHASDPGPPRPFEFTTNPQLRFAHGRKYGVRKDGSFLFDSVLYSGSFGEKYINDFLFRQEEAYEIVGEDYIPDATTQKVLTSYLNSSAWMIFENTKDHQTHWDYSVLGRKISVPSRVHQWGKVGLVFPLIEERLKDKSLVWPGRQVVKKVIEGLEHETATVDAGLLSGNVYFPQADYMVQRRNNYVISMKMFSNRTRNAECVDGENRKGFHLSDGSIFTYLSGDEYKDIFPVWDWYLIPGITVAYNLHSLTCKTTSHFGNKNFVGGVSDGKTAVVTMDYIDPIDSQITWKKTVFFFDQVYSVLLDGVTTLTDAPVYTVLDQRKANGPFYVDDDTTPLYKSANFTGVKWLWHDNIGYIFDTSDTKLFVSYEEQHGKWEDIGTYKGEVTEKVFKAYIQHDDSSRVTNDSYAYKAFPGIGLEHFLQKARDPRECVSILENSERVQAVKQTSHDVIAASWRSTEKVNTVPLFGPSSTASSSTSSSSHQIQGRHNKNRKKTYDISLSNQVALFSKVRQDGVTLSLADPTQSIDKVTIQVCGLGRRIICPDLPGVVCQTLYKRQAPPGASVANQFVTIPLDAAGGSTTFQFLFSGSDFRPGQR